MKKIIDGVLKFKNDTFPGHEGLFADLASKQSPEILMITCADSRIDPAMITQTEPGELFICRNAGNIVPPYTASPESNTASIEFAIAALGVEEIIVCGHTDCGAMKGAMNLGGLNDLPHVCGWLTHSAAAVKMVKEKSPELEGRALLREVTEQNVLLQLQHLKTHPYVAAGLASGKLRLHGWVYDIGEGSIYAHNQKTGTFDLLSQSSEAVA